MGYYSRGTWVIRGPVDQIAAAWTKCRLLITEPTTSVSQLWPMFSVFKQETTGYIRFSFEEWKWHRSCPEIDFFETVWAMLQDYEEILDGRGIHVGEDGATESREFGKNCYEIELHTYVTLEDNEPTEGEPL